MQKQQVKILVLYEELAGYFMACVNKLHQYGIEIHIVSKKTNKEAPFVFQKEDGIIHYQRELLDLKSLQRLIESTEPSLLFIGGWRQRNYLRMARLFHSEMPVVLGFDTQWKNSVKQNIAAVLGKYFLKERFAYCFVPGSAQSRYALKLGFKEHQIIRGAYCADTDLFTAYFEKTIHEKKRCFPHRFIYMARYVRHKGINDLWKVFVELQESQPNDWELWCLGTGDLFEKKVSHEKIRHFGFIQPGQLEKYIRETGVFVLPSRFEPWGVALHEFATAGFPLICSDQVGAREVFLKEGENGYQHIAAHTASLKAVMQEMMRKTDAELVEMSLRSRQLSQSITLDKWAKTMLNMINRTI